MSTRRSFDPGLLARLREMPVLEVLALLDRKGLAHWRQDPEFRPVKDSRTVRVVVSPADGPVCELLATGPRWFDSRADRGGGGAVDLAMHVLNRDFVGAVKALID